MYVVLEIFLFNVLVFLEYFMNIFCNVGMFNVIWKFYVFFLVFIYMYIYFILLYKIEIYLLIFIFYGILFMMENVN